MYEDKPQPDSDPVFVVGDYTHDCGSRVRITATKPNGMTNLEVIHMLMDNSPISYVTWVSILEATRKDPGLLEMAQSLQSYYILKYGNKEEDEDDI